MKSNRINDFHIHLEESGAAANCWSCGQFIERGESHWLVRQVDSDLQYRVHDDRDQLCMERLSRSMRDTMGLTLLYPRNDLNEMGMPWATIADGHFAREDYFGDAGSYHCATCRGRIVDTCHVVLRTKERGRREWRAFHAHGGRCAEAVVARLGDEGYESNLT